MKKCPYCAEMIQDAAIKCRYCGSMIAEPPRTNVSPQVPQRSAQPAPLLRVERFAQPQPQPTKELAWHQRPAVILLLLILLPPIGIALMWFWSGWSHKTKLRVAAAAALWSCFVLWRTTDERDPATVSPRGPRAVETRQAPPPARTVSAQSSSAAPQAQIESGEEVLEHAPLLVAPLELDGFALVKAAEHQQCCGFHAAYSSKQRLEAEIMVDKNGELDAPGKDLIGTTISGHPARISDIAKLKSVDVMWSAGNWGGLVSVHYDREADHGAARKAALAVAPWVAGMLDQYLKGTPPSSTEREQHLASIRRVNADAANAWRNAAPERLMTKIRELGIGEDFVASAELDPLGEGNDVIVTVGAPWHRAAKRERLEAAEKIWRMWAAIMTPKDLDAAHLKLIDGAGHRVGGSGVMGSSLRVEDD